MNEPTTVMDMDYLDTDKSLTPFAKYKSFIDAIKTASLKKEHLSSVPEIFHFQEDISNVTDFLETKNSSCQSFYYDLRRLFLSSLPSLDVFYSYLKHNLHRLLFKDSERIGSLALNYGWDWGYWGRTALYLYKFSDQDRFLTLVLDSFGQLEKLRDSSLGLIDEAKGRTVNSWGAQLDGKRYSEVTSTGLILLPMCELLVFLKDSKKDFPDFNQEEILQTIELAIKEFDEDFCLFDHLDQTGWYINPVSGKAEPINHVSTFAAAITHIAYLTKKKEYLDKVDLMLKFLSSAFFQEKNGSYSWPYTFSPDLDDEAKKFPEFFFKAAVSIEFLVAAYSLNMGFNKSEIDKLIKTFKLNVCLPDYKINSYISPRYLKEAETAMNRLNDDSQKSVYVNRMMFFVAWGKLAILERSIKTDIINMVVHNPSLFPGSWFDGARCGSMMLPFFEILQLSEY